MSGVRRSAALAAALSFIFPGLGQGFSGAFARGILLAAPVALLVVGGLVLLGQGSARLVGLLLDPTVVLGLVVLDAVLLLYRPPRSSTRISSSVGCTRSATTRAQAESSRSASWSAYWRPH